MSSVTAGRQNLLAGYKIPKVQPVASSLQARTGEHEVVRDERESPRAIHPEAAASTATGINAGGDSSLGIRYQTIAGGHFVGKQSRARAAKQRKIKARGLVARTPTAKKLAKRIGMSTPNRRPRSKKPAATSKQPAVRPSAAAAVAGLAEPERVYPVCLGAKARARKNWESLQVVPKPLRQPAPPATTTQSCQPPTPSWSAKVSDSATAPIPESPATISPNEAEDALKSSVGSRTTSPSSKRQQYANTHSPSAEKKRRQAVETSEQEAETPRKAKIRKLESPTSPEQVKADLCIADAVIEPKKDESTPLFRRPSLKFAEKGGASPDRAKAKLEPSTPLSPSDLSPSAMEDVNGKLSTLIKEEDDYTPYTAYIESLEANFQLYTARLRKTGVHADFLTALAAAHQQGVDIVNAVHQANHVTVKAE